MSNFIDDNTPLAFPKSALVPAPVGSTSKYLRATDWNDICQAAYDLREAIIALRAAGTFPSDGDYGDITVSASGHTWTVDNDTITYAKLQNVSATSRLIGRITSGSGDPEELTGTQATTLLDSYAGSLKGLVPAGAGSTTKYLREDGTWTTLRIYSSNIFWQGFGSHGSLHFDGTSVIAGITPASDTDYPQNGSHTYKMSEDIDATNITVDAGVTLITRNYRIFWTGTFTNNGLVGNPGHATTGSGAASAISSGFYPLGVAGGLAQSNSNGAGFAGDNSTAVPRIWSTVAAGNAGSTGQGGQGGTCGGNAGGLGGSLTVTGATSGTFLLLNLLMGRVGTSFNTSLSFGSGGGGGAISGYTSGTAGGGGGGGGGGCVFFGGNILAGNGVFTVAGGAAGSPSYAGGAPCACGGGAGGGGGIGGMIYNTNTGTCTYTAAGGVHTNGINSGGNGNDGAAGTWVVASGDGT